MKLELLLFARLREAAGTGHATVDAADGRTVAQIAEDYFAGRGIATADLPPFRFAVNETFVASDYTPRDGDRLALLTAFAGG